MKTLLIVEDEKMIRQGIRTMVQRSGVPVEVILECANGEMAWKVLQEQEVDAMLTDIRMPKMNGVELVQKLRELPPEKRPLTVAISGFDDFSYAVEMLRGGVREYLLKPIEREKLKAALEKLENEIKEKEREKTQRRQVNHQQLKYFLIGDEITEQELEILKKSCSGTFLEDGYYACCLRQAEEEKSLQGTGQQAIVLQGIPDADLLLVGEDAMASMENDSMLQGHVGISRVFRGVEYLKQAYAEALMMRKIAFCTGDEVVSAKEYNLTKEDRKTALREDALRQISPEIKKQRVQLVGADKSAELEKSFDGLFFAAEKGRITPDEFKEAIVDFCDGVKETYGQVVGEDGNQIEQMKQLWTYECLEEYIGEFTGWIKGLQAFLTQLPDQSRTQHKIAQAVEYVRANYAKDLNMAVVSNEISMNYSLFSYSFKQYTGSNFVTYLRNIRVEEAKRLLEQTDMRVGEISQRVGYENEKHFMKVFRSTCGVSPSEYRKNVGWKND